MAYIIRNSTQGTKTFSIADRIFQIEADASLRKKCDVLKEVKSLPSTETLMTIGAVLRNFRSPINSRDLIGKMKVMEVGSLLVYQGITIRRYGELLYGGS